ncbi:peptide ABC transporter permease [candidate division WWE3 bacterium RIFCSPHIGHO2_01_FULL_48_15]|uniref:Peptide ABC transporter permease n=1 Tax=candidate division WWE3 bacterium RIFCSPHIGHO2_01_FULL_48_15 TaxID=1802619 RepID=A0A1F4VFP4_UNCKA|nr:MAG: peptide ABC transporter permease [candidate division WWE3 bacterium RIFCSPHIGHO2_01_FULL_48_15]
MRKVLLKVISYVIAFVFLLLSLQIVFGATGFSDKILESVVNEQLRGTRQVLAQTIRDPDELEKAVEAAKEDLDSLYGLDKPWYTRLPQSTLRVITFDLGEARTLRSFSGSNAVSDIVLERLPNTLIMMLPSFFLVAVFGLSIGVWAATHVGGRIDRLLSFFAVSSNAIPAWWISMLAIVVFGVVLNILPTGGMYSAPPPVGDISRFLDLAKHAILPIMSLTLVSIGPYMYAIRAMTIRTAQQPFVAYARARGFSESRIRWRYILLPAAPPISTSLVLGLVGSFSGAILTETIFNWQGMGRLYYDALSGTPDEGLVVALTVIYALMFMVSRFVLDVLYIRLDPRVRR